MKFLYVLIVAMVVLALGVSAEPHYLCTCFRPAYDRGCCGVLNGTMMEDGNVCTIPGSDPAIAQAFRKCCESIKGEITKCKHN